MDLVPPGGCWVDGLPPHAWGILKDYGSNIRRSRGLPPHAWGILALDVLEEYELRTTPTCVGNIYDAIICDGSIRDYPHMRGEYHGVVARVISAA